MAPAAMASQCPVDTFSPQNEGRQKRHEERVAGEDRMALNEADTNEALDQQDELRDQRKSTEDLEAGVTGRGHRPQTPYRSRAECHHERIPAPLRRRGRQ